MTQTQWSYRPDARQSGRFLPDLVGVTVLVIAVSAAAWEGLRSGAALFRQDIVTFFLPNFAYLGERLKAGDIPGWNPHQFGGVPFAGDPESGWMYFPAMIAFTLVPSVTAFEVFVTFHILLAAGSAYALARVLDLEVWAAAVAGIAFALGPFLGHTRCCTVYALVAAWLPLTLIGCELGLRAGSVLSGLGWMSLAGFAASQMLGAWIGQGAYYGLLTSGGYLLYRSLFAPNSKLPLQLRVRRLMIAGAQLLIVAFGLAAAGVLPRLDANSESTLAGGAYRSDVASRRNWWTLDEAVNYLFDMDFGSRRWFLGGTVAALALLAPVLARRRHAVPFFAALCLISLLLTLQSSPLPRAFYVLPRFQVLHEHGAERVMVVFFLGTAILAGATVQELTLRARRSSIGLPLVACAVAFAGAIVARVLSPRGFDLTTSALGAMAVAALIVVGSAAPSEWTMRTWAATWAQRLVPVLLLFAVWAELSGDTVVRAVTGRGPNPNFELTVAAYADADGNGTVAPFLREATEKNLARYVGYDGRLISLREGHRGLYSSLFLEPGIHDLLVHNRATSLGLYDLQGYNPVQVLRYTELIDALNGRRQDYHETNLLPGRFNSPIFDVLNVRYVVVPLDVPPGRPDLLHMSQRFATVHMSARTRVLENLGALPRAWLVHDAEVVAPDHALELLKTQSVDPRQTVLLGDPPPLMREPSNAAADQAIVERYEPDQIVLSVQSDAPGMVVLSEVYDPGWRAYVDGKSAKLYLADYALRAVPVPEGAHQVELRYEPRSLQAGVAITATTSGLLLALAGALVARQFGFLGFARGGKRWMSVGGNWRLDWRAKPPEDEQAKAD